MRDVGFGGMDLRGASFVNADLEGAGFTRANLIGCVFRGAKLDMSQWQEARLDRTTDLRGTSLRSVFSDDIHDKAGNLLAARVDLGLALMDESTDRGDPSVDLLGEKLVDKALAILTGDSLAYAQTLRSRLQVIRSGPIRSDWMAELLAETPLEQRDYVMRVFEKATEQLMQLTEHLTKLRRDPVALISSM